MNYVKELPRERKAVGKVVRIESDITFLAFSQPVDYVKERGSIASS